MPHPSNKHERDNISRNKGKRRGEIVFSCSMCNNTDLKLKEKFMYLRKNTTKLCSCFMCGNKRKYFNEKTMQEQKQEESYL